MTSFHKVYTTSLRDPWKQNQNILQDMNLELQLTPNKPNGNGKFWFTNIHML